VLGKLGILDVETSFAREELPVPGVAGGQDAIEEVDAATHTLNEIDRRADTHQITRSVLRQQRRSQLGDVVHQRNRLADAETANGIGLKSNRARLVHALGPKVGERSALNDSELRLAVIGDPD